jgi:hypothetical protein
MQTDHTEETAIFIDSPGKFCDEIYYYDDYLTLAYFTFLFYVRILQF